MREDGELIFMHRLAIQLGATVEELRHRLTERELIDWAAYSRIEPFGDAELAANIATQSALIANCHRGKDTPAFKPKDFLGY